VDLKKVITLFLDEKTKFAIRTASPEWSNIVQITNYTLYNTTKSEWKEVVKSFEKKVDHIQSLSLKQNVIRSPTDILPLITKLTRLTTFNIERLNVEDPIEMWMPLTTLSSLKASSLFRRSLELSLKFPNIADIQIEELPEDQIEKFQSLTNLEKIDFAIMRQNRLEPFEVLPSTFTHLTCILVNNRDSNEFRGGCSALVPHLRSLGWHTWETLTPASLAEYTSLEELFWFGVPLTSVNSSKLTRLSVDRHGWNEISTSSASSLVNLKSLSLDLHNDQVSFSFLTALTALETFDFDVYSAERHMLKYLANSKKLTRLECHTRGTSAVHYNYSHLTQITSLTCVDLWIYSATELAAIGQATQLVDARIEVRAGTPKMDFLRQLLSLEKLHLILTTNTKGNFSFSPSLKQLTLEGTDHMIVDLGLLPNLEKLNITYNKDHQYIGMEKLTRLVDLTVKTNCKIAADAGFLTNLTNLEILIWRLEHPVLAYLGNAMASLRSLAIFHMVEDFEILGRFTNLARLDISILPFSEIDMTNTCLTRLMKLQYCALGASNTSAVPLQEYLPRLYHLDAKKMF
jgi:hypothetical protein